MTEHASVDPPVSALFVCTFCFLVVLGLWITPTYEVVAAEKRSTTNRSSGNLIIPPPLEDLGKAYKVRLVYFVPSDRQVKPNFQEKAAVLMRVVADIYRREMKANKQRTRGLDFEFEEDGRLKVHLVKGTHPSVFYTGQPFDVQRLLNSQQQEIWRKRAIPATGPHSVFLRLARWRRRCRFHTSIRALRVSPEIFSATKSPHRPSKSRFRIS